MECEPSKKSERRIMENYRRIDDNGQTVYSVDGFIELLFSNKSTNDNMMDTCEDVTKFNRILKFNSLNDEFKKNNIIEYKHEDRTTFDVFHQKWNIPESYKNMDIISHVLSSSNNKEETDRLEMELEIFKNRNFLDVLRSIKFVIDTMIDNNITYGVGRGSSVASFVLYKLKVHRIDSLKYDINFNEFLE